MASVLSAGTTSNTALNLSADTTGILQFQTNGTTAAMTINTSQNVGIGTSSPTCRLDLNRGSAGLLANFTDGVNTNFQIETASLLATIGPSAGSTGMAFKTGNTERMRITSSGEVLVGGTTSINAADGCLTVQRTNDDPYFALFRNDTSIVSTNRIGNIDWYVNDTTSNTPTRVAYILGVASGDHSAGNNPTDLTFATTAASSSTVTERMRIDSSGNVGIGTSSPNTTAANRIVLDVNGTTSALYNISTGGTRRATFYSDSTDCVFGSISSIPLEFLTGGTERMRITSGGDLLVGTSSDLGSLARVNILSANGEPDIISMRYTNAGAGQYWRVVIGSDNTYYLINDDSVGVSLADGGTSWSAFSDERLKTDLKPIENAVNKVTTLRAVTGRYKTDEEDKSRSFLIAQDVQNVLPEAVSTFKQLKSNDETEYLSLSYTEVIPLLVAAIKELKAELDATKAEVAALKGVK
jgi:hypothetical protein